MLLLRLLMNFLPVRIYLRLLLKDRKKSTEEIKKKKKSKEKKDSETLVSALDSGF